jgi:hypothetical protein
VTVVPLLPLLLLLLLHEDVQHSQPTGGEAHDPMSQFPLVDSAAAAAAAAAAIRRATL